MIIKESREGQSVYEIMLKDFYSFSLKEKITTIIVIGEIIKELVKRRYFVSDSGGKGL